MLPLQFGWTMGTSLVMDGLAQSEYEHSTSSELQGPRVNLTYRWISQHTPTCKSLRAGACCALPSCAQGLPWLGPRQGEGAFLMPLWGGLSSGWWSLRASHWRAPRLPTAGGFACVVAVFVRAAPLWCDLFLYEDRCAGLGGDGGECRGGEDCPNGGLGNSRSKIPFSRGNKKVFLFSVKI